MKRFFITIGLFVAVVVGAFGQINQGGQPSFSVQNFKKSVDIPIVRMPAVDIEQLQIEDIAEASKDVPPRFAFGHQVNLNPENSGKWYTDSDGAKYWMLRIESKGAKSLNFTFSDFYLPLGSKLFFYNPDKSDIRGAFTSITNKRSRKIGISPVQGDVAIIEYYQPADCTDKPSLQIATVAHDYRGIDTIAKGFGDSGSCNNNVVCPEGDPWKDQIRSVALYTLGDGTRWCSGALINNTNNDGTPYFLTANHCLEDAIRRGYPGDVGTWVFYFNYESPECSNQRDGLLDQSISGSELLARNADTDFLFLRLSVAPPGDYKSYFSGWDATGGIPLKTMAIHHPTGDIKKISFDQDPASIVSYGSGPADHHWMVRDWDDGTTEPGSSGSPLFDQNKRIVGQLHGGTAACGNDDPDFYGRFDLTFPAIKQWLAPSETVLTIDGYDPPNTEEDCVTTELSIKFDKYPEELSWEILDDKKEVLWSGGPYSNQEEQSALNLEVCLEEGCYTLLFKDTFGDGVCCGYGLGNYQLQDEIGILASGAAFGLLEEKEFCVGRNRTVAPISENKGNDGLNNPLKRLRLFPNPAKTILNINYKIKENSDIITQIIDMTGRVIQSNRFNAIIDESDLHINVSQLPEGAYFLKVKENNVSVVKKFMVLR